MSGWMAGWLAGSLQRWMAGWLPCCLADWLDAPQLFNSRIALLYPVDSATGFPHTYPLDSDLSGG